MNNITTTLTTKEANFIAGLLNDLIEADIELTNMTTEEVQAILSKLNSTLTTKEANFIAGLLNDLIEADIELTNMTTEEVQAILNKLSK